MSEAENIKKKVMESAVSEIETLMNIVGELGYVGFKISLCKLHGNSYQQCANKYKISKQAAQRLFEKCIEKRYDIALKKLFQIK